MFLTIGLIIGFAAGWYVNEKFEDLAEASKKLKFWKQSARRLVYAITVKETLDGRGIDIPIYFVF